MARVDPALRRLADAHGVATSYETQDGRAVHVAPDVVVAVLAALGVDASDTVAVRASLEAAKARAAAALLPTVAVVAAGEPGAVRIGRAPTPGESTMRIEGDERPVRHDRRRGVAVLPPLAAGWYTLRRGPATATVLAAPRRLDTVDRLPRLWGWMVQLYALRSHASWGVGDLADLTTLARWTAEHGGDLVLCNPLHAVAPVLPVEPSPYYPGSRRYVNPLYLRIEELPEYRDAPADRRSAVDSEAARVRASTDVTSIDRDRAWAAKLTALEMLFPGGGVPEEPADARFAVWCAIAQVHGGDWRRWPARWRDPETAMRRLDGDLRRSAAFHGWVQRRCRDQLAAAQQAARDAGLAVGIVHDLAVGVDPGGADAWLLQDVLAGTTTVGAPPDPFNMRGQDWRLAPWRPDRLAASGYAPYRELARVLLRHAGGLRIDHILGMFRLWWIPDGRPPTDGTYVRYDADALLGTLLVEAAATGALLVGEDLGTVPPEVTTALAERGILGSSVLYFEREDDAPRPLGEWRALAAASVTTHDLPTATGYLRGEHVRVRAERGLLDDPEAEQRAWQRERDQLVALLVEAGLLAPEHDADEPAVVLAMHAALTHTPSRVVLAAPGDAIGDPRQPNLPGTSTEYPNWRLPLPMTLEELLADPRVARLARVLTDGLRDPAPPAG